MIWNDVASSHLKKIVKTAKKRFKIKNLKDLGFGLANSIYRRVQNARKLLKKQISEMAHSTKAILVKKFVLTVLRLEFKFRVISVRTFILIGALVITFTYFLFYLSIADEIPPAQSIKKYDPKLTTTIYDRKGNVLYRQYEDADRELVPLDNIPRNVINATIAIEDKDFYKHSGISLQGIARAAKRDLFDNDLEGGSTITQQLVKNVFLTPDRTIKRKIKEIILALEIERIYEKDKILAMYLNTISYGGTSYGIGSASKKYFGKNVKDLTLAESAYLAGLPAAPSTFSPYGAHPEFGKYRQKDVLKRMVEDGYITPEEAREAYAENLYFIPQTHKITAPHFVTYTLSYLEEKYGQKLVREGGLEVYTSLDPELQAVAENIVRKNIDQLKKYDVTNGAVIITNPRTGEILAMVGSYDFWDMNNDGNVNVTTSLRQPGSSIKPLMYSLALENGYRLSSVIDDSPVSYKISGENVYSPINYDRKFHGKVKLKTALASSYNVPAVKVLNSLGVDNFIGHAKRLGITTWNNNSNYGLSLALGAGEVKMTDMAVAYGVFANGGYKRNLSPELKIYDQYGILISENECANVLLDTPSILTRKVIFDTRALASSGLDTYALVNRGDCKRENVIKPETAFFISNALSDNNARTPAFGAHSALNITEKQVAVKTGTTQNLRDNWAIGYTNDYLVAAWVGNNDGRPMKNIVSGYRGASIIWREIFDYLIKNRDIKDKFELPENLVEVDYCPLTKTLGCSACKNEKRYFIRGSEPKYHCSKESVQKALERMEKNKNAPSET